MSPVSFHRDHKKLKELLYSAIALCLVLWVILYVQIKHASINNIKTPAYSLTDTQRVQIVTALKEANANSPALTSKQRLKILNDLRK